MSAEYWQLTVSLPTGTTASPELEDWLDTVAWSAGALGVAQENGHFVITVGSADVARSIAAEVQNNKMAELVWDIDGVDYGAGLDEWRREASCVEVGPFRIVPCETTAGFSRAAPSERPPESMRQTCAIESSVTRFGQAPVDVTVVEVNIDPGWQFGSGSHASTRLALSLLADLDADIFVPEAPRPWTVLDVGSGSGILAIAALRYRRQRFSPDQSPQTALGVCLDIEEECRSLTMANAALNGEAGVVQFFNTGRGEGPKQPLAASVVVVNVLPSVHEQVALQALGHLARNGVLILSGFLAADSDRVKSIYDEAATELSGSDVHLRPSADLPALSARMEVDNGLCWSSSALEWATAGAER